MTRPETRTDETLPHTPSREDEARNARRDSPPWGTGDVAVVLGRTARRAVDLWLRYPGRLSPGAWWLTERVWRHPLIWAAVVTAVVLATGVSVGHIVALGLVVLALTLGATTRRERVVSLLEIRSYHKRRRKIRKRWARMWVNAGLAPEKALKGDDDRVPKLKGIAQHPDGVTVHVAGEINAIGVREVIGSARALTETVGALSLRVTKPDTPRDLLHRRTDLLAITFRYRDPFPVPIHVSELPAPTRRGRVVVGLDEERRPLEKSLSLPSLLVGAPGAGKSTEVWTTLRALRQARIPFRLRVFDPKGGTEMGDLRDAAYAYESNPAKWPEFLARACKALEWRQRDLARLRNPDGSRVRKVPISEEWPLDLMIIDELVTVLAMSEGRINIFGQEVTVKRALTVYMSQIRSAGASIIALSQLGEKAVLGEARAMFAYVSCLRVGPTEKELVDVLLGQGAHNAYPAHELIPATEDDPGSAGVGWVRTEKEGVLKYRGAFIDDKERAAEAVEIGKATARYRARGQRDPEIQDMIRRPRGRTAGSASRRPRAAKSAAQAAGGEE